MMGGRHHHGCGLSRQVTTKSVRSGPLLSSGCGRQVAKIGAAPGVRGKATKFRDLPMAIAGRQMSLLFDSNRLDGLEALERSKAAAALARILMQAAGVRVEELDDDKL